MPSYLIVANQTLSSPTLMRKTLPRAMGLGNASGSSVDAQHFSEELVGRFRRERRPLPAQSLSADVTAPER